MPGEDLQRADRDARRHISRVGYRWHQVVLVGGEISALMIEIALRHPGAGMAGAHPAPQEKRQ
jgi:hypothetical protein